MSTNLFWEPAVPATNTLPTALKFVIAPRYWDHDGTLGGAPVNVSYQDLSYFEGIRDSTNSAEVKSGAEQVIQLINENGQILLSLRG